MSEFDKHEKIKDEIVKYSNQFSEKKQKSLKIDKLLSYLSSIGGKEITLEEVQGLFYESFYEWDIYMKYKPVWALPRRVEVERESIDRLSKLLGKHISHMDADEMEKSALKMFTMLFEDYKNLAERVGIELKENSSEIKHQIDGTLLLRALEKIHSVKIEKDNLVSRILNTKFDLGYFSNMFKEEFERYFKDYVKNQLSTKGKKIKDIWDNFQKEYGREKNNLEAHLIFDKKLNAQHKIQPPGLLKNKTLSLDIKILSIEFDKEDKLIVLGQKYRKTKSERENVYKPFTLAKYDIHTGKKISSIDEEIDTQSNPTVRDFPPEGSLSVGSNGIIYAGFYNQIKRFNGNLETLAGNEDGFQDAVQLLKKDILLQLEGCDLALRGLFQATESDGVHYFVARPNELSSRYYENILVASDGKKIIGKPKMFSPSGGSIYYGSDHNARLVIDRNDLYFKYEGHILAMDRSLTEEAHEKVFKMVDAETLEHGFIPSHHCVDRNGLLWAVTLIPEEVVSSIKAYRRGNERGEIVTHLYPLNASIRGLKKRFMAISQNGILAHTDPLKNQINFYQIKEK